MVTELFAVTYFGIAALAVLWNYSALPKIDWKLIVSGGLLMLTAAAIDAISAPLGTLGVASALIGQISAVVAVIAVIFVIIGALQQVAAKMK